MVWTSMELVCRVVWTAMESKLVFGVVVAASCVCLNLCDVWTAASLDEANSESDVVESGDGEEGVEGIGLRLSARARIGSGEDGLDWREVLVGGEAEK